MTTVIKRVGRARSPIRPGLVIKDILMGRIPVITWDETGRVEKFVDEACIVDMHYTYKELMRREAQLHEMRRTSRVMTYSSFCHLFKFARYLGLVEFTHYEPMIFPPPQGHLYQIGKHDGVHVRISQRKFFKLTELGIQDERAWTDLCNAYKQGWTLPQKVEYAEPYIRPPIPPREKITKRPRKPKPREPVDLAPDEFPEEPEAEVFAEEPSVGEYTKMVDHLKTLEGIGLEREDVQQTIDELTTTIDPWIVYVLETKGAAEKAKDLGTYWRYKKEEDLLYELYDKIEERDIAGAVTLLGRLIRERSQYAEYEPEVRPEPEVPEPEPDIERYKKSAKKFISDVQGALDPNRKAASIKRVRAVMEKLDPELEEHEIVTGIDDLENAISEYEDITREGLSPDEYKEEKDRAFEEIVSTTDELSVDEDALDKIGE